MKTTMTPSLFRAALLATSLTGTLGRTVVRNEDPILDFSDVAALTPRTINGESYGCKSYLGEAEWPSQSKWNALNQTVGGALQIHVPPGAVCHNTFDGPLGTINSYDAAACAEANAMFSDEQWQ